LSGCGNPPAPADRHPLAVENRLHALEIPLAKKNETYLVFDLRRRRVQVKFRGEPLRELPILDLKIHRPWNAAVTAAALAKKGLARPPQRTVIVPINAAEIEDTESVMVERVEDSLELADMPSVYSLRFETGASILVLSRNEQSVDWIRRLSSPAIRLLFFFQRVLAPRSPAATLVLSPDDARALYWTFAPKVKALIAA